MQSLIGCFIDRFPIREADGKRRLPRILSARAIDNNDDPLAFSGLFARYILYGEGKIEDFYVILPRTTNGICYFK